MNETQLREQVREALVAYRNHQQKILDGNVIERRVTGMPTEKVRDNALVSMTQVQSALRVMHMEGS